jgi:hypothetical protein
MYKRIASNAVANVITGASAAIFQLGMTAIMARSGGGKVLPLWSLAASLAGFAPLLSCNVSVAVARRLAAASDGGTIVGGRSAAVMLAARRLSLHLTLVGFAAALVLGFSVPFLYPELISSARWTSSWTVGCFFAGSCWVVYSQPQQGWLMTVHRNWPIANSSMVARGAAVLVSLLALIWSSWLAVTLCSVSLWLGAWYLRETVPALGSLPEATVVEEETRQINRIARGFAVWGATSAAVQATTVPFVALLAPALATPLFLAFTLVNILIGAAMAVANALVAPLAQLIGNGQRRSARRAAIRATLLLCVGLIGSCVVVYLFLGPITRVWVGQHHKTVDIAVLRTCFAILALQHCLRGANIVTSIVLSLGAHTNTLVYAPLVEAACVVIIAVPLAILAGPLSYLAGLAAAGTMGGAFAISLAVRQVFGGLAELRENLQLVGAVAVMQATALAIWGFLILGRGIAG